MLGKLTGRSPVGIHESAVNDGHSRLLTGIKGPVRSGSLDGLKKVRHLRSVGSVAGFEAPPVGDGLVRREALRLYLE